MEDGSCPMSCWVHSLVYIHILREFGIVLAEKHIEAR